jgi:DNA recombination protein RmuC
MSDGSARLTGMDPIGALVAAGALLLGVVIGWQVAAARAAAASARERATWAEREQALGEQARQREARDQSMLHALAPLEQTLTAMRQKVEDLERDRHVQFGAVAEQLRRAERTDESLRAATESLAGALRTTATRGVWGETQLRRVVEAAGLTRHVDFELQGATSSDAGAGRPDMIVRLPGGRALAVDAKVPLDAFLAAGALPPAAAQSERDALLAQHVKAVRAHVDALSRRSYWAGLEGSPEFVVCFLPTESLLSTALDQDPALLDFAFGRRVAIATPVNLWAVLKTVAFTWTQDAMADQARELVALGTQLFDRIATLSGHVEEMRRGIERTVSGYNRFVGSLENRVLVTARKFPGIDQNRLDALVAPPVLDERPRSLSAPEFARALDEAQHRIGAGGASAEPGDAEPVKLRPEES